MILAPSHKHCVLRPSGLVQSFQLQEYRGRKDWGRDPGESRQEEEIDVYTVVG